MSEYKLTGRAKRMIRLSSKFQARNPESLSDDLINNINNMTITRREARSVLCRSKHVMMQTFVIPVTEGAVTGYYFSDPKLSELTGVMPLMIFCHGGGWVFGNMDFYSIFLSHLAEVTESAILLIDYRLAPKYKFPTAVEDCYDAVLWAAEGAKYWKIDTDRIFIAGDSAGGNLAAAAALKEYDQTGKTPAGVLLFYPVTDLSDRNSLSRQRYGKGYALDADLMDAFLDCYLPAGKQTHEIRYLSPLKTDLSSFPPALIVTSEYDILHDQGCAFAEALKQKKRRVIHHDYKGAVHIFITVPGMDSFFRRAVHDAASFLREFKS